MLTIRNSGIKLHPNLNHRKENCMTTRIYLVTDHDNSQFLVRAPNAHQALRHVAKNTFRVSVATQDELVDAIKSGATVEVAGTDVEVAGGAE